jgi:K+ transporter
MRPYFIVFGQPGIQVALQLFAADGIDRVEILGILSMIFWSLILVVTVKYVLLIMRADNRGEGGIMALTALAQRVLASRQNDSVPSQLHRAMIRLGRLYIEDV